MILTIAYIVVGLALWFPFTKVILRVVLDGLEEETFDIAAALCLGAIAALFWPLSLILGGAVTVFKRQAQEEQAEEDAHDRSWW